MSTLCNILQRITILIAITHSFAGWCGSVSGGGGNTLPTHPAGPAHIIDIAQKSRASLLLIFRSLDDGNAAMGRRAEAIEILFGRWPDIYAIIKKTKIQIRETSPCIDPAGVETDGSYSPDEPNQICVSAARLGAKLDKANAWEQTIALIGHELSHRLGADEATADAIQEEIISKTSLIASQRSVDEFVNQASATIADILLAMEFLTDEVRAKHSWNRLCVAATQINQQYRHFYEIADIGWIPLALSLSPPKSKTYWEYFLKISGLRISTCGRADDSVRTDQDAKAFTDYNRIFHDRKQLTILEYETAYWSMSRSGAGYNMPIRYIDSPEILLNEAHEIRIYLSELSSLAEDLYEPTDLMVVQ
jgi:hypothetical protein